MLPREMPTSRYVHPWCATARDFLHRVESRADRVRQRVLLVIESQTDLAARLPTGIMVMCSHATALDCSSPFDDHSETLVAVATPPDDEGEDE